MGIFRCRDVESKLLERPGHIQNIFLFPVGNCDQHVAFQGQSLSCRLLGFEEGKPEGVGDTEDFAC